MLHILIGRQHLMFWYKPLFYSSGRFPDYAIWQLVFFDFVLIKWTKEEINDR